MAVLEFFVWFQDLRLEMRRCGRGTTVKMLDLKDIGRISIAIPPIPEQRSASILTSVDEVIETAQANRQTPRPEKSNDE